MKTEFSKEYITANKGCYNNSQLEDLFQALGENPTLWQLHEYLPIKDFIWFFTEKCELSKEQLQNFALYCAKLVLPIYENRYPNKDSIRKCIETIESYLNNHATYKELIAAKAAADDAAANAAYAAAYAAADAAYAAADDGYNFKNKILEFIKQQQ